jgi:uncharacterized RDD family membrane protein YckC
LTGVKARLKGQDVRCPKCGEPVAEGAGVCATCGEPLRPIPGDEITPGPFAAARPAVVYAGFWLRAVAYVIDLMLVTIIGSTTILLPLMAKGAIPADKPWFLLTAGGRQVFAIQLLVQMLCWVYFAGFESSSWQATPGKRILNLAVTDMQGRRITFARASGRFWGKLISQFILFFGFAMAGFTEKKQALHDMLAGCLVIRKT